MTTLTLAADPLPLTEDEHGRIRIAGKRVFLVNFVNTYNTGLTVDELIRHYDMLDPADVHAVLAYYLRNRAAVDNYVEKRNAEAEILWEKIQRESPSKVSHEELQARWVSRSNR